MRALGLALGVALVAALAAAAALDVAGLGRFTAPASTVGLVITAAALGAVQSALWPTLLRDGRDAAGPGRGRRVHASRAAIGVLVAGAFAFLLGRASFGWFDLGALAAGAPGELPLVVLPLASVLAVAAAWPARTGAPRKRRVQ